MSSPGIEPIIIESGTGYVDGLFRLAGSRNGPSTRCLNTAIAIYDAVESGNGSLARFLALVVSAVTIAILYLTNRLQRRQRAG